jgi:predicted amidohydrolase YtcJ
MTSRSVRVVAGGVALIGAIAYGSFDAARGLQGQATPPPDAIYYNAKVVTVDDRFTYAQAIAITGDTFTAVGSNADVRRLAGPNTRQVDLRGLTVIPGIGDNHLHGLGGGPGVDLSQARSVDDVLQAVAARVKQSKPGDLVVSNSNWHEGQLKEQRFPLRRELDTVAPQNPVVLSRGCCQYILNSAALARWNITKDTPVPNAGRIMRYADGELNGEIINQARQLVQLPAAAPRTPEQRVEGQIADYNRLHAAGVTAVRYATDPIDNYRMRQDMQRRGLLTMRVSQMMTLPNVEPAALAQTIQSWGVGPRDGDAMLRVGGIAMGGVDGGFEGALMREPYAEPYGQGGTYRGLQTVAADRYTANVRAVNRLGWTVFTDAIGDAGIDLALAAYEAANAEQSIVGRRWGLEHAFIPAQDQFARMKKLDLYISAHPHLYVAAPSLVKYWGPKRAAWTTPVKAYLDAGLPVSGGSDSPTVPHEPLIQLYHWITRDTITGGVMGADQRVSREQALRFVTHNYWYLSFLEDKNGVIAPGRYADLVVLPEDLMTVPAARIERMHVLMTMVGGKVVYRHADFAKVSTQ